MRAILDKMLWGALIVLFGPSVMIVASWNALPGDSIYGVKLALEKTALALASPSYATAGTLQIKYTERRYAEAKQLLASKQSIQGLPYLEQQIAETKKAIEKAPNKEAQVALAKQYITTLSTVSTDLETQKQSITQSSQPLTSVPTRPTAVPTSEVKEVPTSEVNKSTPAPTPRSNAAPAASDEAGTFDVPPIQIAQVTTTVPISTQQAVAALQINQTQQNVSQTIADLQTLVDNDNNDQKETHRNDSREMNENKDQNKNKKNEKNDKDLDR